MQDPIISYQQMRTILSHISDGVVIIDRKFNIILLNKKAATIAGCRIEDIIFKNFANYFNFLAGGKPVIEEKKGKQLFLSWKGKKFNENTILINKNGETIKIAGSISSYRNRLGEVKGLLLVFRDVTKEKNIDLMKTEFTSLASHQLRTPLTAIRWFIEELYNEQIGKVNAEQKDYLKQIMESNTRMIKLVNDLLDVSRLEAERVSVEPIKTDVKKLAEDVINDYIFIARANNCRVELESEKLPSINVDPALVKEVLSNLISNAIKYSASRKGENIVNINIIRKEPNIQISVKDSGIGIPKNFYKQIFKKFSRGDNATKVDTGGTGFGLYISKILVEISGGKIWFDSKENKGTTFYFTLPLAGSQPKKGDRGLVSEEEGFYIKN